MSDNTTPDFDFDFNGAAENFDEEQRVAAERRRQRAEQNFQRDWKKAFDKFSSTMRNRVKAVYESKSLSYAEKIAALGNLLSNGSTTTPPAANTGSSAELEEANQRVRDLTAQLAQASADASTAADEQRQKYEQLERESNLALNAITELANRADVELTDFELVRPVVNQAVEDIVNGFKTKFQSTRAVSGTSADQQLLIDLETDIRTGLQKIATKAGVQPVENQGKIDIKATATRIVDKIDTLVATPTFDVATLRRLTGELVEAHGNSETARMAFKEIDPNAEANKLTKTAKTVVEKLKRSGTSGVITYATFDQIDTLDDSMNAEEALIVKIGEELDK